MAIKILSRGTPPEEVVYEGRCSNCGTTATFARADAQEKGNQHDGTYLAVACPVCLKDDIISNFKKHKPPVVHHRDQW